MKQIDGAAVAQKVHQETRQRIEALAARGIQPGLAVVLVGDDPASRAYVRSKDKRAAELGFHSVKRELPATTTQEELLAVVQELNNDPRSTASSSSRLRRSRSTKPPSCEPSTPTRMSMGSPVNVAKLALEDPTGFVPCTPLGCIRLLEEAGVPTAGANAVVVGRSMIVGKPMALLLMRRGKGGDATVTVAHSRSKNLAAITRSAEIVIAAVGRPHFLGAEHIGEGAVVIDVGINRIDDPTSPKGTRLVGDVDYDAVAEKCAAITLYRAASAQ